MNFSWLKNKSIIAISVIASLWTQAFATKTPESEEKESIIIVGTAWTMSKYIKDAINELGYKPILLVDMDGYSTFVKEQVRQNEWYHMNVNSYEEVERFLEENWGKMGKVAAITSLTDMKLPIAIKLSEKFHVKGPDAAILKITDKNNVVEMIPEYSPKTIHFRMENMPLHEIHGMIDAFGAVVIKPSRGSGALGTIILEKKHSREEIEALLKQACISDLNSLEWLSQARIDGTLYSIEGFCKDAVPTFLGFTRRSRLAMTEMTMHFPSDKDPLIQEKGSLVYEAMKALIERSGFKNGYFHTEFLINSSGAYLIDANFGRIGGAAIIEQIAYSFGIRPEEIAKHIVDVGLFEGKQLSGNPYHADPRPSYCLCYGMEKGAIFRSVQLPNEMKSPHTLIALENTYVTPIGDSDYSWVGLLSGNPDQVIEDVKKIQIETRDGTVPAYYYVD